MCIINPSTAKGEGSKLPPRAHFCLLLRQLYQQPKFLRWLSWICFLHGMVLVLTSCDFASWRHNVSKWRHFFRKMEISIYTVIRSGIMENWIKHELYHLNNEILWWHDVTHDTMSSHDIRDMTSMHDFISIRLNIWLLLYVAVSELERWFYFCFAR